MESPKRMMVGLAPRRPLASLAAQAEDDAAAAAAAAATAAAAAATAAAIHPAAAQVFCAPLVRPLGRPLVCILRRRVACPVQAGVAHRPTDRARHLLPRALPLCAPLD